MKINAPVGCAKSAELQEETGEGWPHWHIMIDVSALPGLWYNKEYKATVLEKPDRLKGWIYVPHYLDLNRVHYLLRKWEIGEQCRLSVKKENFKSIEHAINYISKYLIKMPKKGFPEWMLNTPNLRFMGASKSLGTLISKEAKETKEIDSANRKTEKSGSHLREYQNAVNQLYLKNMILKLMDMRLFQGVMPP